MNKTVKKDIVKNDELVALVLAKAGRKSLSKVDVKAVSDAVFEVLKDSLLANKSITVKNFGTFKLKARSERKTRNFGKDTITIPASYAPSVTFSSKFKDEVKAKVKLKASKKK